MQRGENVSGVLRAPQECPHIILLSPKGQEFRLSERMKEEGLKLLKVKERAQNPVSQKAGLKVKGPHETFQGL